MKNVSRILLFIIILAISLGVTAKEKQTVKIVLMNGHKIEAEIKDIYYDKIIFRAKKWKDAYEYGEVINVERVVGIQLDDGTMLSVQEYDKLRRGEKIKPKKTPQYDKTKSSLSENEDLQYEDLKKKPISEMTDNEFKYFIMMRQRELEAEKEKEQKLKEREKVLTELEQKIKNESSTSQPEVQKINAVEQKTPENSNQELSEKQIEQISEALIDAGIATDFLRYIKIKNIYNQEVTDIELTLQQKIENNPRWQETLDNLKYITRVAKKTLARAYLYNPEELQSKLKLQFDPDLDMNFMDLVEQLHLRIGEDVKMRDFRLLVEVLGENGARAVKDLLENYSAWKYLVASQPPLTISR